MDQDVTVRDDDLLFTVDDGIGRVTFNRPQARNAFTFEMYERLAEICERANRDPGDGHRPPLVPAVFFQGAQLDPRHGPPR